MVNEKITDFFIGDLLNASKIDRTPNGSNVKEIQKALKTVSKKGRGKVGFSEFSEENIDRYYSEQVLGEIPIEILELEDIMKNIEYTKLKTYIEYKSIV